MYHQFDIFMAKLTLLTFHIAFLNIILHSRYADNIEKDKIIINKL